MARSQKDNRKHGMSSTRTRGEQHDGFERRKPMRKPQTTQHTCMIRQALSRDIHERAKDRDSREKEREESMENKKDK